MFSVRPFKLSEFDKIDNDVYNKLSRDINTLWKSFIDLNRDILIKFDVLDKRIVAVVNSLESLRREIIYKGLQQGLREYNNNVTEDDDEDDFEESTSLIFPLEIFGQGSH